MAIQTEMTFLESFRYIDTYTEAVIKLREAAHTISRHGADLKEWEVAGEVVKTRIKKEIDELTTQQAEKRRKGIIAIDSLLEKEAKAKEEIEPTFERVREARSMLDQVSKELNQAREDKALVIESTKADAEHILKEARAEAEVIETGIEDKIKAAKDRLLEVDASIKQLKKEGINSL